jgi:hypothetical protein
MDNKLKIELLRLIYSSGGKISFTNLLGKAQQKELRINNAEYEILLKEYESEGLIKLLEGNGYNRSAIFELTDDGYNKLNPKIFDIDLTSNTKTTVMKIKDVIQNQHIDADDKSWRLNYLTSCLTNKQQNDFYNHSRKINFTLAGAAIFMAAVSVISLSCSNNNTSRALLLSEKASKQTEDAINIQRDQLQTYQQAEGLLNNPNIQFKFSMNRNSLEVPHIELLNSGSSTAINAVVEFIFHKYGDFGLMSMYGTNAGQRFEIEMVAPLQTKSINLSDGLLKIINDANNNTIIEARIVYQRPPDYKTYAFNSFYFYEQVEDSIGFWQNEAFLKKDNKQYAIVSQIKERLMKTDDEHMYDRLHEINVYGPQK